MAKEVYMDIDEKTGDFTLEAEGFKGKGCKKVLDKFKALGKTVREEKKPEYDQAETNATVKAGQ